MLPLSGLFSTDPDAGIGPVGEVACWLVFLADLVMQLRFRRHYLRSGVGRLDLAIVVVTFPWMLLFPGFAASRLLSMARLARVARVAFVAARNASGLRRLGARLGRAAVYAAGLVLLCAIVVKRVEPPSSGYANLWDAIWWGIVTITTVGYGDLYPVTVPGRIAGITLMLAGIGLIGALAGSLASFFTTDTDAEAAASAQPAEVDQRATAAVATAEDVRALRNEIVALRMAVEQGDGPTRR